MIEEKPCKTLNINSGFSLRWIKELRVHAITFITSIHVCHNHMSYEQQCAKLWLLTEVHIVNHKVFLQIKS